MARKAPGRHQRKGITSREIFKMFPDSLAAEKWFESILWDGHVVCPHCGAVDTAKERKSRAPMPYHCPDCRKYFSVKTNTCMARSKIPLEDWAFALYLQASSLKGVSSMKLHRELDITQKSAWFMAHRIREAYEEQGRFSGEVELDEDYFGGLKKHKRGKNLPKGTGSVGKTIIVGVKERASGNVHAEVVQSTDRKTLHGIIEKHVEPNSYVYTDEERAYRKMPNQTHKTVRHGVKEYVRGRVHVNGVANRSGRFCSGDTWAFSTSFPRSICSGTSTNSPDATTSAIWTLWTRCATWSRR